MQFGKDYIIPTPFDPRLIYVVTKAVAKAAMDTGVAQVKIEDWENYDEYLYEIINGQRDKTKPLNSPIKTK